MQASFIVTFIGDDRPGLVERLSSTIEHNGGNWSESRLSQLAGTFAGLILVSLPEERAAQLETDLRSLSSSGLSVRVTPCSEGADVPPGRDIRLSIMGPDRHGIVREISHALAQRQINVVEMDSAVHPAAMSSEMIFQAHIQARIPENSDMGDLSDSLDDIANAMTLEIDLE
ncbi:MAG: ACT domain-containing protein [Halioglobus sp.]|nr:ACT domain-containing protein [Halioglobus sp.]